MAKPTKVDLQHAVTYLEAELEASRCATQASEAHNASLQRRIDELSAELMRLQAVHHDASVIKDRGELLVVARSLSRDGVPCFVRGTYIYHAQTKAILAQVRC